MSSISLPPQINPEPWRKLLVSVSYKMVGSLAEAEDLASEVILKWLERQPAQLDDPQAYAVRMVINLSLDRLRELKKERVNYPGPWLPEPVLDPEIASGEFSIGMMRLLEVLNPIERAVFILRTGFDHDFEAVGEFVDKSPENCRKILSRARQKLAEGPVVMVEQQPEQSQIVEEILLGFEERDFTKVFQWLHKEVVLWSDGGGKVFAALVPIHGDEKVALFLGNIARAAQGDIRLEKQEINGHPGILVYLEGKLESVMAFEYTEGKVSQLLIVRNPDKIARLFSA